MGYQFWIGDVLFPVPPPKLQIKIKNQNQTVTLINEGEINLKKLPGLSEVSFELLLPNRQYPFAVYLDGFRGATYYLSHLELLKTQCQVFKLKVLRMDAASFLQRTLRNVPLFEKVIPPPEDFAMQVTLEDYEITQDSEDGNDFRVSIQLKEYRSIGTNIVTLGTDGAAVVKERPAKAPPKTYTVQQGDYLSLIAKKVLGKDSRWKEIYTLNQTVFEEAAKAHGFASSSQGARIFPGTVLQMPS